MQGLFEEFIAELKTKDAAQIKQELKEMEAEDRAAEKAAKKAGDNRYGATDSATLNDEKIFDYVISNPPYQVDISKGKERSVGTRTSRDVFPDFHKLGVEIARNVVMIYPATWQKKITAGFGKWLFDNGLKSSENHLAKDVFNGSIEPSIMLSIVDTQSGYSGDIDIEGSPRLRTMPAWISSDMDNLIYEKTREWSGGYLSGATYMTTLTNLHDSQIPIINPEDTVDNNNSLCTIYIKRKPGKQADAGFFNIRESDIEDYLTAPGEHYDFNKYNVVIQSAVFGRQSVFDRMLRQIGTIQARVFDEKTAAGITLASLRSFDTREEAEHFAAYMNSKLVGRLLYFDYSKRTFASFVPDLGDYTSNNPEINWDEPLDPQLLKLFNIEGEEIIF